MPTESFTKLLKFGNTCTFPLLNEPPSTRPLPRNHSGVVPPILKLQRKHVRWTAQSGAPLAYGARPVVHGRLLDCELICFLSILTIRLFMISDKFQLYSLGSVVL